MDLTSSKQHKLKSEMSGCFSPCFINGETDYVAVGGDSGDGVNVEVWDIASKTAVKQLEISGGYCSTSTNNITMDIAMCRFH